MLPRAEDRYCRPSFVRELGRLTATGTPDSRLLPLIEHMSRAVDSWTGRVFGAVRGTVELRGGHMRGRRGWGSEQLPIPDCIAVETVEVGDGLVWWPAPAGSWSLIDWAGGHARTLAHTLPGPLLRVAGLWGWADDAVVIGQIAAPMGAADELVTFGQSVEPGDMLVIDDEQMLVTDVSGSTITVRRGANGTVAAAHLAGAAVRLRQYPRDIAHATALQVLRQLTEAAAGFGGAIAAGDVGGGQVWPSSYPMIRDLLDPYRLVGVA